MFLPAKILSIACFASQKTNFYESSIKFKVLIIGVIQPVAMTLPGSVGNITIC